jgi:uncharacterized protein YqeY
MSLLDNIDKDLAQALKSGDRKKVTVLRGLKSDMKYRRIEKREELTDSDAIDVLSSAAKRRRESIEQYRAGNRDDLADQEQYELEIINSYLPEQFSEEKLRAIVSETISEVGAQSPADLGKVMKAVMPKVKGQADGKQVNRVAGELLGK